MRAISFSPFSAIHSLPSSEDHISEMYDQSLQAVAAASIDSQLSLSLLNILQNAVISFGVALAMALAGREVVAGSMSIGDFGACAA